MLLSELRGRTKRTKRARSDVKWNRLNKKLYVRLLDVNVNLMLDVNLTSKGHNEQRYAGNNEADIKLV